MSATTLCHVRVIHPISGIAISHVHISGWTAFYGPYRPVPTRLTASGPPGTPGTQACDRTAGILTNAGARTLVSSPSWSRRGVPLYTGLSAEDAVLGPLVLCQTCPYVKPTAHYDIRPRHRHDFLSASFQLCHCSSKYCHVAVSQRLITIKLYYLCMTDSEIMTPDT